MDYEHHKQYIIKYFHTENGRGKLKEAQIRYNEKEEAKEYNRMKALRYYHRRKAFNDEFSRLSSIQIF